MASPPHPRWEDLPADLLADIADRLPCFARAAMSRVCSSWRKGAPRPSPLPWLLLPYRSTQRLPPDGVRTAAFFCVLCSDNHQVRIGNDTGGARFFGSYDGGWLFLAHDQTGRHALVNLHSDKRISLPDSVSWVADRIGDPHPMVILVATLSSPPPRLPTEQCIAAAIVDTGCSLSSFRPPQFAFWRVEGAGDQVQVASGFMWPIAPSSQLVDVIYHREAFHFLTQRGDVVVCIPESQEGGLVVHEKPLFFLPPQYALHHLVHASYLVESRGELLMVVRRWCTPPLLATSAFRVFQMTQQLLPDGVVQHTWTDLPALDGRMLFVARGCSRSFDVADFAGFEESVYFLDDRNSFDVTMMLENHPYRQYTCSANGRWSEGPPPSVQRWFPDQAPSNYSSPVWFLP